MDRNPQAKEMADESMVRNLAAQAEAIWPQELLLLQRYALPDAPAILGCVASGKARPAMGTLCIVTVCDPQPRESP